MRGLLVFVLIVALLIAVVGLNRGWFQVTTQQLPSNQIDVNLRVDPNVINKDVDEVKREAEELVK